MSKTKSSFRLFVLSVLIFAASCQKKYPSSVSVDESPKAGVSLPGFPLYYPDPRNSMPSNPLQRVVAFDNGSGSNCFLGYDLGTETVTLVQVQGTTLTTLWSTTGLNIDGTIFHFGTNYNTSEEYNDVGGTHMIALDLNGSGHMDHLVVYVSGRGIVKVLQNLGGGLWHAVTNSTTGIGGYDMMNITDKIIAYDLGNGTRSSLICYRPGYGNCWVIQNQPTASSNPNWVGVVKGSGGIGGFDLKGIDDQLIAVDNTPGNMNLVCYRPGVGYVWYLSHNANTTSWTTQYSSRTGFPGVFDFADRKDRMIPFDADGTGTQNYMFCYRPGQKGYWAVVKMNGTTVTSRTPSGDLTSYPMSADPYAILPNWSTPTYAGDRLINFSGNGLGYSSILAYESGYGTADIYYMTSAGSLNFTQIY
jgi:hypothetical protein